jgi:aminoglycoside N3'-acetyltransferase
MLRKIVRTILPTSAQDKLRKYLRSRHNKNLLPHTQWQEADFIRVMRGELGIARGDTIFVHSSFSLLKVGFGPDRLLELCLDLIGPSGNLIVPSYPPKASLCWLQDGDVFDLRSTPSAMGVFTEFARKYDGAVRSLHPTKACAVIGPEAKALTADHHLSPYAYGEKSPYYRAKHLNAKLVGLGVWTYNLSFVHTCEDTLLDRHPFCPYWPQLFQGTVIKMDGGRRIVSSFAHDLERIGADTTNVPEYIRKFIDPAVCKDVTIQGRRLFIGHAALLYGTMISLVRSKGETLFQKAQATSTPEKEIELWRKLQRLTGEDPAA